jgi:hypothetical protein
MPSPSPARLSVSPGGLIKSGEMLRFSSSVAGHLDVSRNHGGTLSPVVATALAADTPWSWQPADCGQLLATFTPDDGSGDIIRRPLAVVNSDWAVCQITVGAFTAEDFADIIHGAGVSADYYIEVPHSGIAKDFSATDPRWCAYERRHGDAIHPHVMANALGGILPEHAHDDPNWDSLPGPAIEEKLRALQGWWSAQGFLPLDRLATYTPSNPLVAACRATGIRVIHSLCAEQNWSDGEWIINHWGMPTAPYWIADDDFRKTAANPDNRPGVMGIIMNHYQVLLPHLTHWGDFVLSPSHFTRWLRAADSGEESTRFRQFLADTVRGGTPLGDQPFFFVAGFEFGRTFGTADMTDYNRAGLRRLIELSGREKLAFATSSDVRAYYDRHVRGALASRVFRQRDSWSGVTVNGKPGEAGDSVVIERDDYKSLVREDSALPFFYYDYRRTWTFSPRDVNMPDDFAAACARELSVERPSPDRLIVSAEQPLSRPTPVVVWDATVVSSTHTALPLRPLDDGRAVALYELPAGWSGREEWSLAPHPAPVRDIGDWSLRTFGEGADTHTYLHLKPSPLRDTPITVTLRKPARIDGPQGPLGEFPAGPVALPFGPLRRWYRLWGCTPADLAPDAHARAVLAKAGALVPPDGESLATQHAAELDALAWSHPALHDGQRVLAVHCGAKRLEGTRSRAEADDVINSFGSAATAHEFADGVISFGPGQAFWYHPRTLHFRITGVRPPAAGERLTLLLNSYDPLALGARYRLRVGPKHRDLGLWTLPADPKAEGAFFTIQLTAHDFNARGHVSVEVKADQKSLVRWWDEGGFIAALHAFWVARTSP